MQSTLLSRSVKVAYMNTLSERMRLALDAANMDQSELARLVNVSSVAVNGWCTGATKSIKGENLLKASSALGVDPLWLSTGKGEMLPKKTVTTRPIKAWAEGDPIEEDEVEVMRLDLKLSAGSGRLQWEIDEKGARNRFRKSWCDKKGFKPEHLTTVMVDGDSMSPTLIHGASITINTADTSPRNGKVYAIDYQGEFLVKRLFIEPSGQVIIVSDNPDKTRFKSIEVPTEYSEALRVLGKVVSQSSDVD